jgi:hypothetical protein
MLWALLSVQIAIRLLAAVIGTFDADAPAAVAPLRQV